MIQLIVLAGIINYLILNYMPMGEGEKAYVMIMVTLVLFWLFTVTNKNVIEGIDQTIQNSSFEAIQNLASMYNEGKLKMTNIEVTDSATIAGKATINNAMIGDWNVRGNRMGIGKAADT